MVIERIVHPELDLTEQAIIGEISVDDVLNEVTNFLANPVTKLALWDVSQASITAITSEDIMRIAELVSRHISRRVDGRSAVVAATDLSFGFSRMYQAYREMHNIQRPYKCFRTRQEAMDWLFSDAE